MKLILANPRGFCAGVNMAIESLERALDLFGSPIYAYHEIVQSPARWNAAPPTTARSSFTCTRRNSTRLGCDENRGPVRCLDVCSGYRNGAADTFT